MCHPGLLALRTHPYTKHILHGHELAAVLTAAIPLGHVGLLAVDMDMDMLEWDCT